MQTITQTGDAKMTSADFVVDGVFSNSFGNYKVVAVDGGKMTVEYLTGEKAGQQQNLDTAGQAKVIRNRHARELQEMKMRDINLNGRNEAFTLGYLAQNAYCFVRVKESSRQWFEATYRKLTGADAPTPNVDGHYYSVISDDVDGQGNYFNIGFPTPPDCIKNTLSFGDESAIHWDSLGSSSVYNSMNYVLNLFRLGFRIGKNHEVDTTRVKVEDKDSFDKGFFYSGEEIAA